MVPQCCLLLWFGTLLLRATLSCSLVPQGNTSPPADGLHFDRRSALAKGVGCLAGTAMGLPTLLPTAVVAAATEGSALLVDDVRVVPPGKTVLVLGANGGTGRLVVQTLVAAGGSTRGSGTRRPCVAATRSGLLDYDLPTVGGDTAANGSVKTLAVDVASLSSVRAAIGAVPDLGAVVFCASSSKDAFGVDRDGVVHAAASCLEFHIPRLVVVSSGAVSRPDSPVYLLLNTVAKGIMEAKIQGEDAVRALYRDDALQQQGIGYTIVRPGGLTNEEPVGSAGLELNQGDTKSGRLSRQDVAAICVACLDSPDAFDATFECYEAATAKPLESVGISNILKMRDPTPFRSGMERRGATWAGLFRGLTRDA